MAFSVKDTLFCTF